MGLAWSMVTSAAKLIVSAPLPCVQPPVAVSVFAAVIASASVQLTLSTVIVAARADGGTSANTSATRAIRMANLNLGDTVICRIDI